MGSSGFVWIRVGSCKFRLTFPADALQLTSDSMFLPPCPTITNRLLRAAPSHPPSSPLPTRHQTEKNTAATRCRRHCLAVIHFLPKPKTSLCIRAKLGAFSDYISSSPRCGVVLPEQGGGLDACANAGTVNCLHAYLPGSEVTAHISKVSPALSQGIISSSDGMVTSQMGIPSNETETER